MGQSTRFKLALIALLLATLATTSCASGVGSNHPRLRVIGPINGAWSLSTPGEVRKAAAAGVNLAFTYTTPPTPNSDIGQALQRAGIGLVDARIGALARSFECHRTQTSDPPTEGNPDFCSDDSDYTRQDLHDDATRIVREDKANPLVIGLWTLDDTPVWDPGALRSTLEDIHTQASGLPTICGFAAHIGDDSDSRWDPRTAANFSDRACDYVAPYIYARPHQTDQNPPTIDWSMRSALPTIERDLRSRGWDDTTAPLLGIGQAWGGRNASTDLILDQPHPEDMITQAGGFCRAGAAGVAWYAWQVDQYPRAQTPSNNPELLDGVARSSQTIHDTCHPQAP